MRKVILNKCYGGFDVSYKAYQLYAKKKGLKLYMYKLEVTDNGNIYKKVKYKGFPFLEFFIKDFGDVALISEEEYAKYNLFLDINDREDPILIEVVEELGKDASGRFGNLVVVEIPDDLDYVIDEYDGIETLHQRTQEW